VTKQKIRFARELRHTATAAERLLWKHLRLRNIEGYKFRRQYPIGEFVADFACLEAMLVIEVDGGQHADSEEYDLRRTKTIEAQGFRVLRFWNNEVLGNIDGVLQSISAGVRNTKSE
jgi:very-short-patch-repair endonuclease